MHVQFPGPWSLQPLRPSRHLSLLAGVGYWGSLAVYCLYIFVLASAAPIAVVPLVGPCFMRSLRLFGPGKLRCVASLPSPCRQCNPCLSSGAPRSSSRSCSNFGATHIHPLPGARPWPLGRRGPCGKTWIRPNLDPALSYKGHPCGGVHQHGTRMR